MTETTATKKFTTATWDDVTRGQYFTHQATTIDGRELSWTHFHDLSHEIAQHVPNLDAKQLDVLMSAVYNQQPVVITFDTNLGGSFGPRPIERTTTVAMAEYIAGPRPEHGQPGYVRISYPGGFTHDLRLDHVVQVEYWGAFTTREYLTAEQAAETRRAQASA